MLLLSAAALVANIVCAWLALLSNVALFVYWLYKMKKHHRNPWTNCLFFDYLSHLADFSGRLYLYIQRFICLKEGEVFLRLP